MEAQLGVGASWTRLSWAIPLHGRDLTPLVTAVWQACSHFAIAAEDETSRRGMATEAANYSQVRIWRTLSSVTDQNRYKKNVLDTLTFSEVCI